MREYSIEDRGLRSDGGVGAGFVFVGVEIGAPARFRSVGGRFPQDFAVGRACLRRRINPGNELLAEASDAKNLE